MPEVIHKFPFKGEAQRSAAMTEARCMAHDLRRSTGVLHTWRWDGASAYVVKRYTN